MGSPTKSELSHRRDREVHTPARHANARNCRHQQSGSFSATPTALTHYVQRTGRLGLSLTPDQPHPLTITAGGREGDPYLKVAGEERYAVFEEMMGDLHDAGGMLTAL